MQWERSMNVIQIIAQHGYAMTAAFLFFAALGLPIPVAVALLAAGAASHAGLNPLLALGIAWLAAMVGDVLLYLGGRHTGWWLLAGMCRLSLNPEQCIFASADSFYRKGPQTLLIAKFIPGLGTVAAPLAGSLNMRFGKFLRLMAVGEALYCSAWFSVGYGFYKFIDQIAGWMEQAGHAVLLMLLLIAVGYAVVVLFFIFKARRFQEIDKITAVGLRERLDHVEPNRIVVIADVRSHNYYDPGMQRIKNSIRIEPNRLQEELEALQAFMAPECEIYLYCSCLRDTTSVRVAHALNEATVRTTVIEGGMKAWVRAGGAMERVPDGEVRRLPQFD
jgi:membrane protein DedA with SNARE-associated domain/rhodanese-related sulfurtransferase